MMQQGITYSADANAKSGTPAEGDAKAEQGQATQAARGQAVKEKVIEYCKRTLFLVVGLAIMSFGVALSIQASLGTSPISGIPYVLNLISGLSVGTTTIIVNVGIVALQVILLRRRFKLIGLLQIPVCIVFGLLTDVALVCIESVTLSAYWAQWLICLGGILLVAVGVSFEVAANVATLPGEGLVLTICTLLPKVRFGYMKVARSLGGNGRSALCAARMSRSMLFRTRDRLKSEEGKKGMRGQSPAFFCVERFPH